jgi:hypothetical protein
VEVVPFAPEHLGKLKLQSAQAYLGELMTGEQAAIIAETGPAFSGFIDGEIIGCCGLIEQWPGRAIGWALLGQCGPRAFAMVHREAKRFLDEQDYRRIETTVEHDFCNGHRWVRALGFELETPDGMRAWSPDGRTFDLYARVKS